MQVPRLSNDASNSLLLKSNSSVMFPKDSRLQTCGCEVSIAVLHVPDVSLEPIEVVLLSFPRLKLLRRGSEMKSTGTVCSEVEGFTTRLFFLAAASGYSHLVWCSIQR